VSVQVPEGQSVELTIKANGFKDTRVIVDGSDPSQSIKLESLTGARGKPQKPVPQKGVAAPAKPGSKRPALGGGEIIDPWSK